MLKYLLIIPCTILTFAGHAQTWLPTVTTTAVTLTTNTATGGGNIVDVGASALTARGICWDTSPAPTVVLATKTMNGTTAGTFTAQLTGLQPSTTYYVRAFANNATGVAYGNEVSFTTLSAAPAGTVLPSISRVDVINSITTNSAISGGYVNQQGSSPVTARGVCWSSSGTPTVALATKTLDGAGTGAFTSVITGLSPLTTYQIRAYATSAAGTTYMAGANFSTNSGTIPVVTTTPVSAGVPLRNNIAGGNVTNGGSSPVSARGVCWSTSPNPNIGSPMTRTANGSGTGAFTATLEWKLIPGTTYYLRAYAVNGSGTAYGNQVTYVPPTLPTVSTMAPMGALVANLRYVTGSANCSLTVNGGSMVNRKGVVWGTTPGPTLLTGTSSFSISATSPGYESSFNGEWNTKYYLRAYATNEEGTSYGNEISFTTPTFLPVLSSATVSAITTTSATVSAKVTDPGTTPVTAQGVCYSKSPSPVYSTTGTGTITVANNTGLFSASLPGLTPNTKYYVRAFAKNSGTAIVGTADVVYAYGPEVSFTTVKQ